MELASLLFELNAQHEKPNEPFPIAAVRVSGNQIKKIIERIFIIYGFGCHLSPKYLSYYLSKKSLRGLFLNDITLEISAGKACSVAPSDLRKT